MTTWIVTTKTVTTKTYSVEADSAGDAATAWRENDEPTMVEGPQVIEVDIKRLRRDVPGRRG